MPIVEFIMFGRSSRNLDFTSFGECRTVGGFALAIA
jgi:hypothetical protein